MRRLIRVAGGIAIAGMLAALAAMPTLAGNFAEVTILSGGDTPPVAGEERELRFRLLQHGVTPVDFGEVEVVAMLSGSDDRLVVAATSAGNGEWLATVTFPESGAWRIGATHSAFETSPPTTLTVAAASAQAGSAVSWPVAALLLASAALLVGIGAWGSRRRRNVKIVPAKALRAG